MIRVSLGTRPIGDGAPCFVIAEAGSNHNGSLDQAKKLIDVAARACADAVKFQLFRAQKIYVKSAGRSDYLKLAKPIYDVIADMEMPYEWLPELVGHCQERGIVFLASPFDEESADRLAPFVEAFKVASYEMTHIPLIRHLASTKKLLIVSTGTATLDEVTETVDLIRQFHGELVLLQCTAAYPAPLDSLNVRAVATLKRMFRVPAGLSDHSRDPLVGPMAAVAVGADVIEKHFTLSNELPGPDHAFAVEPSELALMVQRIRAVETALGTGEKIVQPVESELRAFARRSVFALRDIARGETLTPDNVAVLRSGKLVGRMAPRDYPALLGRRAARDIRGEAALGPEDAE